MVLRDVVEKTFYDRGTELSGEFGLAGKDFWGRESWV